MSRLAIYISSQHQKPIAVSDDGAAISRTLAEVGVRFEQWSLPEADAVGDTEDEILSAYRQAIDALSRDYQFQSIDVVSLQPEHPQRAEFRQKFLAEHTHADFEVRFFVAGRGAFYLHIDGKVYIVLCEKGDLISVPEGTRHWFDMGSEPRFTCIRFFTTADGWVGDFTGSSIAEDFPDFDSLAAA